MRFIGTVLFVVGLFAAFWAIRQSVSAQRPRDLVLGIAGMLGVLVAILGLILCFVPGFLG